MAERGRTADRDYIMQCSALVQSESSTQGMALAGLDLSLGAYIHCIIKIIPNNNYYSWKTTTQQGKYTAHAVLDWYTSYFGGALASILLLSAQLQTGQNVMAMLMHAAVGMYRYASQTSYDMLLVALPASLLCGKGVVLYSTLATCMKREYKQLSSVHIETSAS